MMPLADLFLLVYSIAMTITAGVLALWPLRVPKMPERDELGRFVKRRDFE